MIPLKKKQTKNVKTVTNLHQGQQHHALTHVVEAPCHHQDALAHEQQLRRPLLRGILNAVEGGEEGMRAGGGGRRKGMRGRGAWAEGGWCACMEKEGRRERTREGGRHSPMKN